MKKLLLFSLVFMLIGCDSAETKRNKINDIGFRYAQNIVKESLIDPESAQFKDQKGYCGQVNSKNKMGGYVGFKKFIILKPEQVVFEDEQNVSTKQFPLAWQQICAEEFATSGDGVVPPNFKLPDAVYDKPKYNVTEKYISSTPKELVVHNGTYVYPELTIRCLNGKTSFILLSFKTPSFDSDGVIGIVNGTLENPVFVPFDGVDGVQEFYADVKVKKLMSTAKDIVVFFKSSDGEMSMQKYDMNTLRELMKAQKNQCNWSNTI